jgi:hypothetical protein
VCAAAGGKASACAAGGTSIGAGRARRSFRHFAAVEEFALQNFPQTRLTTAFGAVAVYQSSPSKFKLKLKVDNAKTQYLYHLEIHSNNLE